jgi:hypothetical protein
VYLYLGGWMNVAMPFMFVEELQSSFMPTSYSKLDFLQTPLCIACCMQSYMHIVGSLCVTFFLVSSERD